MAAEAPLNRPAFYALRPGRGRELITLLHPPYILWHLSYVALGAAVAPVIHVDRLLAALGAFFLAVGISAHALDELRGRPLQTGLPRRMLIVLAGVGLIGACAIGVIGALTVDASLFAFVAVGAFLVLAYNLELFGGRFHTDLWFALAWGAFPALTGYWANALSIDAGGVLVAGGCLALSVAQRRLSTPVRELRRRTLAVQGRQVMADGRSVELSPARLAAPLDGALAALSLALPLVAGAVLAARL
jgi:hypothetical protein